MHVALRGDIPLGINLEVLAKAVDRQSFAQKRSLQSLGGRTQTNAGYFPSQLFQRLFLFPLQCSGVGVLDAESLQGGFIKMKAVSQPLIPLERSGRKSEARRNPTVPAIRLWQNLEDFHGIV